MVEVFKHFIFILELSLEQDLAEKDRTETYKVIVNYKIMTV